MTTNALIARHRLSLNHREELLQTVSTNSQLDDLVKNAANQNVICRCATALIAIGIQLQLHHLQCDVNGLRHTLSQEVIAFVNKAEQNHVDKMHIDAARYILCAALDEFILNQQLSENVPWQAKGDWSNKSLINIFYFDVWGGETFFSIAETMLENPQQNIEVLELIVICLQLGFEGKYRLMDYGKDRLDLLRGRLLYTIKQQRGTSPSSLSPALERFIPRRMAKPFNILLFILCLLIAVIIYITGHVLLMQQVKPIQQLLQSLV